MEIYTAKQIKEQFDASNKEKCISNENIAKNKIIEWKTGIEKYNKVKTKFDEMKKRKQNKVVKNHPYCYLQNDIILKTLKKHINRIKWYDEIIDVVKTNGFFKTEFEQLNTFLDSKTKCSIDKNVLGFLDDLPIDDELLSVLKDLGFKIVVDRYNKTNNGHYSDHNSISDIVYDTVYPVTVVKIFIMI